MKCSNITDWNAYYSKPNPLAKFTRGITQNLIIRILEQNIPATVRNAIELGGGATFLAAAFFIRYPELDYHVVDNCDEGLSRISCERVVVHRCDLLACTEVELQAIGVAQYDLVLSLGLIEHFRDHEIERIVQIHERLVKPGGYILITYPTPTLLYRISRMLLEFFGKWIFVDETPLLYQDVEKHVKHSDLLQRSVNWFIGLTQEVVLLRKRTN